VNRTSSLHEQAGDSGPIGACSKEQSGGKKRTLKKGGEVRLLYTAASKSREYFHRFGENIGCKGRFNLKGRKVKAPSGCTNVVSNYADSERGEAGRKGESRSLGWDCPQMQTLSLTEGEEIIVQRGTVRRRPKCFPERESVRGGKGKNYTWALHRGDRRLGRTWKSGEKRKEKVNLDKGIHPTD